MRKNMTDWRTPATIVSRSTACSLSPPSFNIDRSTCTPYQASQFHDLQRGKNLLHDDPNTHFFLKLWAISSWSGATPLLRVIYDICGNDMPWFLLVLSQELGVCDGQGHPKSWIFHLIVHHQYSLPLVPCQSHWVFCPVLEVRAMRLFRKSDGRSRGPAIVHLKTWSEVLGEGLCFNVSGGQELLPDWGMRSEATGLRLERKWCRAYLNVSPVCWSSDWTERFQVTTSVVPVSEFQNGVLRNLATCR